MPQKKTLQQLFEHEEIKNPNILHRYSYDVSAFVVNPEKLTQNKITEKINNNGDKKTGNAANYPVWG